MKIKVSELEGLARKAIENYGYTAEEVEVIQKVLMYAQLRGNNQGVVKLINNGIPKRETAKAPVIVKEGATSALVDGNHTHAMIVMDYITDLAIKKAKESGISITGNFNSSESTGALGYYVEKIASEGLIGIAFASAPFQTTAPHGSYEAKFCTNPMAYCVPTDKDPIILDMSTSAMAYYGLIQAKTAGKEVPSGIGYDSEGSETTDPAAIMSGALKTFGGHKGAGLALIVQIMAGAFVHADSFDNDSDNAGNLIIAINPEVFSTKDEFVNDVSDIVSKVKAAKKLPGVDEILIPGERGNEFQSSVSESGEIEVEDNLLSKLKEVAQK